MFRPAALSLAITTFLCSPCFSGVVTTTPGWNGFNGVASFGEPDTGTFGQTFVVRGTQTSLDSFSFWIDDYSNPDVVDFAAYVMEWSGSTFRAIGDILYQSDVISTTNNGGAGGMEKFTFSTGGLNLEADHTYVMFLSASSYFDEVRGTSTMGGHSGSDYADGLFVYMSNGSNFSALTQFSWGSWSSDYDLAFEATFSEPLPELEAVPEPSSFVLYGLGAAGMLAAGALRRRMKSFPTS